MNRRWVMLVRRLAGLLAVVSVGLAAGCNPEIAGTPPGQAGGARNSGDIQDQIAILRAFGVAFWDFADMQGRAPAGWEELGTRVSPIVAQSMQADGYVISWGIDWKQLPHIGTSDTVLAYLPASLTDGGLVLLLDGSAMQFDAATLREYLQRQSRQPAGGAPQ